MAVRRHPAVEGAKGACHETRAENPTKQSHGRWAAEQADGDRPVPVENLAVRDGWHLPFGAFRIDPKSTHICALDRADLGSETEWTGKRDRARAEAAVCVVQEKRSHVSTLRRCV